MKGATLAVAILMLAVPLASATPAQASSSDEVIVAVLDTGINPDHETFEDGQLVAWYDFARFDRPKVPDTLWDPDTEPSDDFGHGTAVAGMVGGTDTTQQTPSHAPGVELAVADIAGSDGSASWSDVEDAIHWAVDTVEADVISLSYYSYFPQDGVGNQLLHGLSYARDNGVLPVVLTGNGMNNEGSPTLSWMHPPASSPDALVVGGADANGEPVAPDGSMDPEVTAQYFVTVPNANDANGYFNWQGTSFSTPLVAGMAASLIQTARDQGLDDPTTDRLERLLKLSAEDTDAPPTYEGYGFLDADGHERALTHARDGTSPTPSPTDRVNQAYVDGVGRAERAAWSVDPGALIDAPPT